MSDTREALLDALGQAIWEANAAALPDTTYWHNQMRDRAADLVTTRSWANVCAALAAASQEAAPVAAGAAAAWEICAKQHAKGTEHWHPLRGRAAIRGTGASPLDAVRLRSIYTGDEVTPADLSDDEWELAGFRHLATDQPEEGS